MPDVRVRVMLQLEQSMSGESVVRLDDEKRSKRE